VIVTIALLALGFVVAPLMALALCRVAGDSDRAIERMHPEPREEGCEDYGSEIAGLSEGEAFSRLGIAEHKTAGYARADARGNRRAASRRTVW
jgi:hypothetical protein